MSGTNGTEWLDDDEQRTWRSLMLCMQLLQQGLDRQLQREADMPHAYYGILVALSEAEQTTRQMSELASLLAYSPSRLSHAVSRMEAAGWVARRPCDTDRRVTFATLTAAGARALADAAPGHVAFVRRHVFAPLTEAQQHELRAACALVADSLLASGELDPLVAEAMSHLRPEPGAMA